MESAPHRAYGRPAHVWAFAAAAILAVVGLVMVVPLFAAAMTPLAPEPTSTEYESHAFLQLIMLVVVPLVVTPLVVQVVAAFRLRSDPRSAAAVFLLLIAVGAALIGLSMLAGAVVDAAAPGGTGGALGLGVAGVALLAVAVLDGLAFTAAGRAGTARPILG